MQRFSGQTLLAVWLIAFGGVHLLDLTFRFRDSILSALAIAAGILLLKGGSGIPRRGPISQTMLAIWLILHGTVSLVAGNHSDAVMVQAILAVVTGVLLISESE